MSIFNEYIKQNINDSVKKKHIFVQLTFVDWSKINHVKKNEREKLIQILIFF